MRFTFSVHVFSFCVLGTLYACGGAGTTSPQLPPSEVVAPPTLQAMAATSTRALPLLQIFDFEMSSAAATAAAGQVSWVWGAGSGSYATAKSWLTGNPNIMPILYFYQGVDDPNIDSNTIGGNHLAWFQKYHPSWVVYDCDAQNRPTKTVAYQPGLPGAVPLDISNADVVSYQIQVAGRVAAGRGDRAIGADQTVFFDYDGGQSSNWFGCGVYAGPNYTKFVRKWGAGRGGFPNYDPKWASDTANWVKLAKHELTTNPSLAPYHLKLIINHPTGSTTSADEQTLVQYADANLDESAFSNYGNYVHEGGLLSRTLRYMTFWQSHGTFLVIDKFYPTDRGTSATAGITSAQLSWAIGSFLLGNLGHAALYVTSGPYGVPSYFPQYTTVNSRLGVACGPYASSGSLYYRRFSGGYVVANDSTAAAYGSLPLPASRYVDVAGRAVTNPLRVPGTTAYVLFSTGGC